MFYHLSYSADFQNVVGSQLLVKAQKEKKEKWTKAFNCETPNEQNCLGKNKRALYAFLLVSFLIMCYLLNSHCTRVSYRDFFSTSVRTEKQGHAWCKSWWICLCLTFKPPRASQTARWNHLSGCMVARVPSHTLGPNTLMVSMFLLLYLSLKR